MLPQKPRFGKPKYVERSCLNFPPSFSLSLHTTISQSLTRNAEGEFLPFLCRQCPQSTFVYRAEDFFIFRDMLEWCVCLPDVRPSKALMQVTFRNKQLSFLSHFSICVRALSHIFLLLLLHSNCQDVFAPKRYFKTSCKMPRIWPFVRH